MADSLHQAFDLLLALAAPAAAAKALRAGMLVLLQEDDEPPVSVPADHPSSDPSGVRGRVRSATREVRPRRTTKPGRQRDPMTSAAIVAARQAGKTYPELAREFGRSESAISRVLKAAGVTGKKGSNGSAVAAPADPTRLSVADKERLAWLVSHGATTDSGLGAAVLRRAIDGVPLEPAKIDRLQAFLAR